jgi:hypothetical protein
MKNKICDKIFKKISEKRKKREISKFREKRSEKENVSLQFKSKQNKLNI